MNLGDIIAKVRFLSSEATPTRFKTSDLAMLASDAQRQLAMDIEHPQGRMEFAVTSTQREFQLPEMVKLLRVYVVGGDGQAQPIPGSDLPTLEGQIQGNYDGARFMQETTGTAFPQTNLVSLTGAIPMHSPAGPYQRASYYMRGGYIGFSVPILPGLPSTTVRVDYIPSPPDLASPADNSLFPSLCKDALSWYVIHQMLYSDNNSGANDALGAYQQQVAKLRDWTYQFQASRPKSLVPTTARSFLNRRGRR